jgi:hypothetical protein
MRVYVCVWRLCWEERHLNTRQGMAAVAIVVVVLVVTAVTVVLNR